MTDTTTTADTTANHTKDQHTLAEVTCDLIVIEHRLRDLRRWTSEATRIHLDSALSSVATAMDALYAEYDQRTHDGRLR